jgi:hypothetical protein
MTDERDDGDLTDEAELPKPPEGLPDDVRDGRVDQDEPGDAPADAGGQG